MSRTKPGASLPTTTMTTLRGYRVVTVDAFELRSLKRHDEEFSNFAIHSDFPTLIPAREIWIDARLYEAEGLFCLANALVHLAKLDAGVAEDRAYEAGLKAERKLRERLLGIKFRGPKPHRRTPPAVYVDDYATLPDPKAPVEARLVDGNLVRSTYRTDYVEGGHWRVYPWVPHGQIWLEQGVAAGELPFVLAHEYTELRLMRDEGLEYDPAHEIAAKVEFALRSGEALRDVLTPDGHAFTKAAISGLTTDAFFAAVKKRYKVR